jgi:uncharacterized phage protein (TIGR02218 family)
MPKTLPAALTTHIAGDVTTLAACWRVTRTDGTIFRFTDLDRDVEFPAALTLTVQISAGETYRSLGGFRRSAVETRAGLKVDNLDLTGLLTDDSTLTNLIQLQDVQVGKFSNAEIEIFLCDWTTPGDGVIPIHRGHLGEVTLDVDTLTYKAEMRGLSQKYAQKIGEIFGPTCRVDLFSVKCGLVAADFTDTTLVDSVTSRQVFLVPQFQTLVDPEPDLSSGLRTNAVEEPDSTLRLSRGPAEDGTPDRPFLVQNTTDLTNIRNNPTAWYALDQDIDMSGFGYFTPIPDFRGGIDGRGFAILELDVDRVAAAAGSGPAALIAELHQGAVIRRLGFRGGVMRSGSAAEYAAPLAAEANAADKANNYGVVEDCYAIGCEIITDGDFASGLIGQARDMANLRRLFSACRFNGTMGAATANVLADDVADAGQAQADFYADSDRGKATAHADEDDITLLTTAQAIVATNFSDLDFVLTWQKPSDQTAAAYVDTGGETVNFNDVDPDTITRTAGSFITDGFEAGDRITVASSVSNNGTFDVASVAAATLTLVNADSLTTEGISGATVTITAGKYPRLRPQRTP